MRALIPMLLLVGGAAGPTAAQWYVGSELAVTRYGGSSRDTSGSHAASNGHPGDGAMVSLRLGWDRRRFGIAVRASYASPGLTVAGQDIRLTDESVGPLLEFAPAFRVRVAGIGPSGAVRAELGPALHLWDVGDEIRSRLGVVGAAAYEWPVTGRFSGAIRLEGMLSPSWFDAADLPPDYERRLTWRYGLALGLRYRL